MTMTHASKKWFWELAVAVAIIAAIVASAAWERIYDTGTHYHRGIANFQSGRYRAAVADYDRALRLDPDAARIYGNRGLAKRILGRYREAIADYDQAVRLQPESAFVYFNRGLAKADMGLPREALADLKTALEFAQEAGASDFITRIEEKIQEFEQE